MPPKTKMSTKTRVLIVDDDLVIADYLASHLARRNFEVNSTSSVPEALRTVRTFDPGIVLLDMSIGGMTGADLLLRLKQIKPSVAIIVLSASKDPEVIFKASKSGAGIPAFRFRTQIGSR